jgi:hypothetical protein
MVIARFSKGTRLASPAPRIVTSKVSNIILKPMIYAGAGSKICYTANRLCRGLRCPVAYAVTEF